MNMIKVTPENFKEIISNPNQTVLVDFYADWCDPCKALAPILDSVSGKLADGQVIAKLNTDECKEFVKEYKVMGIPTMIMWKNGVMGERFVGVRTEEEILEMFK